MGVYSVIIIIFIVALLIKSGKKRLDRRINYAMFLILFVLIPLPLILAYFVDVDYGIGYIFSTIPIAGILISILGATKLVVYLFNRKATRVKNWLPRRGCL